MGGAGEHVAMFWVCSTAMWNTLILSVSILLSVHLLPRRCYKLCRCTHKLHEKLRRDKKKLAFRRSFMMDGPWIVLGYGLAEVLLGRHGKPQSRRGGAAQLGEASVVTSTVAIARVEASGRDGARIPARAGAGRPAPSLAGWDEEEALGFDAHGTHIFIITSKNEGRTWQNKDIVFIIIACNQNVFKLMFKLTKYICSKFCFDVLYRLINVLEWYY